MRVGELDREGLGMRVSRLSTGAHRKCRKAVSGDSRSVGTILVLLIAFEHLRELGWV